MRVYIVETWVVGRGGGAITNGGRGSGLCCEEKACSS